MGALALAPAEALPAPTAELKAFLRVETGEEEALLAALLRAAAETCEAFTGRVLTLRAAEEVLSASTGWTRLAAAPVRSIDEVAALAADGSALVMAPGEHELDIDAAGDGWVRLTARRAEKRLRVRYTAGLAADPNGVPEPLRHGIVRLAAHLYSGRGVEGGEPPTAVAALWRPWRRLRLR